MLQKEFFKLSLARVGGEGVFKSVQNVQGVQIDTFILSKMRVLLLNIIKAYKLLSKEIYILVFFILYILVHF
jgi:hypothetical protein